MLASGHTIHIVLSVFPDVLFGSYHDVSGMGQARSQDAIAMLDFCKRMLVDSSLMRCAFEVVPELCLVAGVPPPIPFFSSSRWAKIAAGASEGSHSCP